MENISAVRTVRVGRDTEVRYDGPFVVQARHIGESYTVVDRSSPAHGASFIVRPGDDIGGKLAEVVERFEAVK